MNSQLARYLHKHSVTDIRRRAATNILSYPTRRVWKLRDRLSENEVAELIAVFKAGTPKHELAERYGIGMRSVKKLLREGGVKRQSWYDARG